MAIRFGVCVVAGTVLLALCWYGAAHGPELGVYYHDCLRDPARWDGHETMISTTRVLWVGEGRFAVHSRAGEAVVEGLVPGLTPGVYLDVKGVFHRNGTLTLRDIHLYRERLFKVYGSLAVFVWVCGYFLWAFLLPWARWRRLA